MNELRVIPIIGIPLVKINDDIAENVISACSLSGVTIEDNDVLIVAQKIVSKAEGAVVSIEKVNPSDQALEIAKKTNRDPRLVQIYLDEAEKVLFIKGRMVITKHRLGYKMSSSGVDTSNIAPWGEKIAVLLPKDPDASARKIRQIIMTLTGKKVAVIINDSCGRDDREGSVGMAIGIAGISALEKRKQTDLFNNPSNSEVAYVDELAATGSLLMGQADECIPVVLIKGAIFTANEKSSIQTLLIT